MSNKGHVYLRINKNYVATVRDLNSLASYLEKVGDMDDSFGEIVEISNFSELRFYKQEKYRESLTGIQKSRI